jgi:Mrp family chromosome partitioning ATPase
LIKKHHQPHNATRVETDRRGNHRGRSEPFRALLRRVTMAHGAAVAAARATMTVARARTRGSSTSLDKSSNASRRRVLARHAPTDGSVAEEMDTTSMPAIFSAPEGSKEAQVLDKLRRVIDPDFGEDIVNCGFVKALNIDGGKVLFAIELTTPACPVKAEFERSAKAFVSELDWVEKVTVTMTAQEARNDAPETVEGLKRVRSIIAVSSCKGGVGKSTTSVNLAYTLAMMGAKVGILDADVYGPSLPTMISPEVPVLEMDKDTGTIKPVEYEGVKVVSFGFAGQGSAIMRGPMVSGLINQLLTTTDWGELDYLIIDMPPGTGDIQLTLCQVVPITAAVVVTTPQKLAFIDVEKGVRMFAKLAVPCVSVVENMSYFEVDGVKHKPFGEGSGAAICDQYGVPNLLQMPIVPDLSACGDTGRPLVLRDPTCETSSRYQEVAATLVREVAKLSSGKKPRVDIDPGYDGAFRVEIPGENDGKPFWITAKNVRMSDTSARVKGSDESPDKLLNGAPIPDDIAPIEMSVIGNYAMSITWPDGLSQVAAFSTLAKLERLPERAS